MSRLLDAYSVLAGKASVIRNANGEWSYWLGGNPNFSLGDKLKRSLTNPALFTAFNLRSTIFSRAEIKVVDDDWNEIEDDPVLELFSDPNYMESQQDFLKKHLWFKGLGTTITKAIPNTLNGNVHEVERVASLEHLIPSNIAYGDVNKQKDFIISRSQKKSIEDRIIKYKMSGEEKELRIGELAFFYDIANNMTNESLFKSPSRMDSLISEICNIEEAQRSKNKNLVFSAKWLASNQRKGMQGVEVNLENDERDEIENKLFHKSINATNADVNVNNLSNDFRKLLLDDGIASDAMRIFSAYGINKDVLNWWMNGQTTYDNKENGVVDWIQNDIQLEGDDFANTWTTFFNYREQGKRIVLDYSHLPIMQVLETKRMEGIAKQSEILERLVRSGVSMENALRISGLDETEA